jgi:polysaccharide export outer membrane protein
MNARRALLHRCGLSALLLGCALGCAHRVPTPQPANDLQIGNLPSTAADNFARLGRLAAERRAAATGGGYVLGEGDLLSVRASGVDDLTQRVRVEADGTVTLPLLGTVPVAKKTVAEAQRELARRLGVFMYQPQVMVFVEEYRSQQVGVVGAVQRPGPVSLSASHATVLDALSAAGGMSPLAGGRIYLIPTERRPPSEASAEPAVADATTDPTVQLALAADGAAEPGEAPIMLDVKELGGAAAQAFYALPVRGGDVIMVPGAGEFIVEGWVTKPGNYPIKSSLTLRGAIATGGGLTFPADTNRVRIHRLTPLGKTETRELDLAAVLAEREPDVLVHDGDVIEVGWSAPKIVPWAVYKMAVDLVHVGAGIRVVP